MPCTYTRFALFSLIPVTSSIQRVFVLVALYRTAQTCMAPSSNPTDPGDAGPGEAERYDLNVYHCCGDVATEGYVCGLTFGGDDWG
jgi:hypothetical protein